MVLGFSHITWASPDMQSDGEKLAQHGYRERFREIEMANSPEKREYLSQDQTHVSMSFSERPKSLALELVSYPKWAPEISSGYQLLIGWPAAISEECSDGADEDGFDWTTALGCLDVKRMRFGCAGVALDAFPCDQFCIRAALLRVPDINAEVRFWVTGLGMKLINMSESETRSWAHLAFLSVIPQWRFNLVIVSDRTHQSIPWLDGLGCTCASVVVTNVPRLVDDLGRLGYPASRPFKFSAGGSMLLVAMVRSPGGAIVELMNVKATK